jgi:hypothetical protein
MQDRFETFVEWYVVHVPGWAVGATCLALYPGVGLILPLAAHWRTPFLVEANGVGTVLAMVVGLAWFIAQIQAGERRHLLEWTTSLRVLDSTEFEWLVGEMFRREGWSVEETGTVGKPDGNIDLVLTRRGERRLVQCKRWTAKPVGVDDIRQFGGTLMRERLEGRDGVFVTLSTFTEQARQEAADTGIVVLDNKQLVSRIENVRRPEPCPACAQPMILSHSNRGWWLRCQAGGCLGKRDLGGDAGRAVQYLTEA